MDKNLNSEFSQNHNPDASPKVALLHKFGLELCRGFRAEHQRWSPGVAKSWLPIINDFITATNSLSGTCQQYRDSLSRCNAAAQELLEWTQAVSTHSSPHESVGIQMIAIKNNLLDELRSGLHQLGCGMKLQPFYELVDVNPAAKDSNSEVNEDRLANILERSKRAILHNDERKYILARELYFASLFTAITAPEVLLDKMDDIQSSLADLAAGATSRDTYASIYYKLRDFDRHMSDTPELVLQT